MSLPRLPILALIVCSPRPLPAQECTALITRTSLSALAGTPIRSVAIVTLEPQPLPGTGDLADRLHVRTLQGTIRRQLLFSAGDTVDTLRVAETLRTLRSQRYISDVWIEARTCVGAGGADLTVTVRDSWSTRPKLRFGSSSAASIGIEELNLLGTGRSVSAHVRSRAQGEPGARWGAGFMVNDPWLPVVNLAGTVRIDAFADGGSWLTSLRTRDRSVYEPWRGSLTLSRSNHTSFTSPGESYHRSGTQLSVARVVLASPNGVTSLLAGAESERARLDAAQEATIIGPRSVRREFLALDLGLRRESASYDTLTWLLPREALVDIPRGFEGEALIGAGRDWSARSVAVHVDLWGGRVWRPTPATLLVTDIWGSGFLSPGRWDAGNVRVLVSHYSRAARGSWIARVGGERHIRPDPDIRTLALSDATARAYPPEYRLAKFAVYASVERSAYLARIGRSWSLEGALFGAASIREQAASGAPAHLHASVLGTGIRLAPRKAGRATARLDIGYAVARSPGLRQRPFVAISVVPWLGAVRQRSGSRE
ncbi:MAG: hypothetical protein ACR2G6_08100 [Gemmatimonadaceae bacterium]